VFAGLLVSLTSAADCPSVAVLYNTASFITVQTYYKYNESITDFTDMAKEKRCKV